MGMGGVPLCGCLVLVTFRRCVTASCQWASDAVMYHIFVDRFERTPGAERVMTSASWRSVPTRDGFMGGTLQGIIRRLPYLQDLGVNLLCLTPIFLSSSNHRYNVYDYYRIDPRLGSLDDFHALIAKAHAHQIRVIIDGVFNHCGRGFFPFYDVMENGASSSFADWFHIKRFPVHAYGVGRYRGWQGRPVMPILNLANREVQDYFLGVARYWTSQGIDGWRLDAVGEVRGYTFWKLFRRAVREINPHTYMLAEFWGDGKSWLHDDQFDGGTNYVWRDIVLDFLIHRTIRADMFSARLSRLMSRYPWPQTMAMVNALGSHDTKRLYTVAKGNMEQIKMALAFQYAYPGIPTVYYGDEIGLEGGNDPDNRRTMTWRSTDWNHELRTFVRRLIEMRRALQVLRHGDCRTVLADPEKNFCMFSRRHDRERALVVIHNHNRPQSIQVPLGVERGRIPKVWKEHLTRRVYTVQQRKLLLEQLAPQTCLILTPEDDYS